MFTCNALTRSFRLFGDGQSCARQIGAVLTYLEPVDDDDDEDDDDDDASETSSLVSHNRRRSTASSLPTSRKPSPMPHPFNDGPKQNGVMGRITGMFGGSSKKDNRGGYNTISDH